MADMGGSGIWGGLVQSGVGIVGSVYGMVNANKNRRQLAEMEKNRPVYTRPEEAQQYLEIYKNMTGNRELPGQSQYEQNIQQATTSGVRNIQNLSESPTSSLGAMTELYGKEMNAYNNLAVQQQQYYEANQQKLAGALSEMAKYRDMEFEYNKNAPYMRSYGTKMNEFISNRGLMQQGTATVAAGLSNVNWDQMRSNKYSSGSGMDYGQMQNDINSAQNQNTYDYSTDNSQNQNIV